MKTSSEDYHLLSDDELLEDEPTFPLNRRSSSKRPRYVVPLFLALIGSLCLNVFFGTRNLQNPYLTQLSQSGKSKFAGLTRNVPTTFERGGIYFDEDEAISNAAWDAIEYYHGTVALDHDYAASMGLPRSQNFPWDDTKGIYFLNGFHDLHCVKRIRRTMLQLRDGIPLTSPVSHSLHCLNSLRQDILCAADDTPLYTSYDHPGAVGFDQPRQCRSWEALEDWANERTACWRDINSGQHIDTLYRYRYCPEGSPYNEHIHAIFGEFDKGENASAFT
ncbi:hypothetical protein IMSHALPRED_002309 [Imshaugia aleurites]|uniref:Uncharacterized protein n=1 Tax=Imshaugia aleurites TaxID=172621 RepID=A0A8H3EYR1_9LECA|nr:hypothetical protein IMSHALPRED_002309 [Imshaugia aleurites]